MVRSVWQTPAALSVTSTSSARGSSSSTSVISNRDSAPLERAALILIVCPRLSLLCRGNTLSSDKTYCQVTRRRSYRQRTLYGRRTMRDDSGPDGKGLSLRDEQKRL